MKGQVSAEMLILLAVVVAIVAIAAAYMMDLGEKSGQSVQESGQAVLHKAEATAKGKEGDPCIVDSDCISDSCDENVCS
ncbi:class III signal peptide-containing protein [Candidatus Micrarchaeota archaeon]|nr:class III signal peptide-containing protein [Candidatus Micrarchaeota archaeon]